jgi:hypothetical protein
MQYNNAEATGAFEQKYLKIAGGAIFKVVSLRASPAVVFHEGRERIAG